jgi:hypothetical protein
MVCLVYISCLALVLLPGDRDWLYRLGPTEQSFYLRTETESSLRNVVFKCYSVKATVKFDDSSKHLEIGRGQLEGYRTSTLQDAAPSLCYASLNGRPLNVIQSHGFPLSFRHFGHAKLVHLFSFFCLDNLRYITTCWSAHTLTCQAEY